jgi:hypothetical protein
MKQFISLALIGILTLVGCSKSKEEIQITKSEIKNTHLVLDMNFGERKQSLSFPMDDGVTVDHLVQNLPGEPTIKLGCQFVGIALAPKSITSSQSDSQKTDIYVVSLKIGDEQMRQYPLQYFGGKLMVSESAEVKVYFTQK